MRGQRGGFPPPYRFSRDLGLVVKTTRLEKSKGSDGDSYWPPVGRMMKDLDDDEEEAENRRLFYVAVTRAQDLVILSAALKLNKDGALPQAARRGPLGWLEAALSGHLPAGGGGLPTHRAWRWDGLTLVPQSAPSEGQARYPGVEAGGVDAAAVDVAAICERIAPVPAAADGQTRFAATELSLYHDCPRLYELERRLGMPGVQPAFGAGSSSSLTALEFGTVVHRALQLVGTGGREELDRIVPPDAQVLRVDTRLDRRAAGKAREIRRQMQSFLDSDLYLNLVASGRRLRSEVGMTTLLDVGGRSVLIEGKIDALVETADGGCHLLDYKTGEGDKDREQQYLVQLGLYCHAVKAANGSLPVGASLVYLSGGGLEVVELGVEAAARDAVAAARRAIEGIWRGEFGQRGSADGCARCLARRLCHAECGDDRADGTP